MSPEQGGRILRREDGIVFPARRIRLKSRQASGLATSGAVPRPWPLVLSAGSPRQLEVGPQRGPQEAYTRQDDLVLVEHVHLGCRRTTGDCRQCRRCCRRRTRGCPATYRPACRTALPMAPATDSFGRRHLLLASRWTGDVPRQDHHIGIGFGPVEKPPDPRCRSEDRMLSFMERLAASLSVRRVPRLPGRRTKPNRPASRRPYHRVCTRHGEYAGDERDEGQHLLRMDPHKVGRAQIAALQRPAEERRQVAPPSGGCPLDSSMPAPAPRTKVSTSPSNTAWR